MNNDKKLIIVLILGILLRTAVFFFQTPFNNDDHFLYLKYIHENNKLPLSHEFQQASHPPLYYILASFSLNLGGAKTVQLLSLLLSAGTLIVFYFLIKEVGFIKQKNKIYCLLFASLLPQFVFFGNYISNDSLSIFLGSLMFLQTWRYINQSNTLNIMLLSIIIGLGLLTKAIFLMFIPAFIFLIFIVNKKEKSKAILPLFLFISIAFIIGNYKYMENFIVYRNPLINNEDFVRCRGMHYNKSYQGARSFYDINILKLIKEPYVSDKTTHSYPLILYATFWYQYIDELKLGEKNNIFKDIGRIIYILAIIPTLIMFLGGYRIIIGFIRKNNNDNKGLIKGVFEITSLILVVSIFLFIFYAGLKYDVWSFFQSRYIFPSFFSLLLLINSGLESIKKYKNIKRVFYILLAILVITFIFYFAYGIYYMSFKLLPPLVQPR